MHKCMDAQQTSHSYPKVRRAWLGMQVCKKPSSALPDHACKVWAPAMPSQDKHACLSSLTTSMVAKLGRTAMPPFSGWQGGLAWGPNFAQLLDIISASCLQSLCIYEASPAVPAQLEPNGALACMHNSHASLSHSCQELGWGPDFAQQLKRISEACLPSLSICESMHAVLSSAGAHSSKANM